MASTALDAAVAQLDALIAQLEAPSSALPTSASRPMASGPSTPLKQDPSASPPDGVPAVALRVPRPGAAATETGGEAALSVSAPIPAKSSGKARPAKGGAAKGGAAPSSGDENEDNFAKSFLQVGLVQEIEAHPNSDKLFVCKLELGAGETCQVVTGLQKFYRAEELARRKVVLIRNLKTAKLAGTLSEAMILAGASPLPDGGEVVKVLDPPAEASVGDRVYLEGGAPSESPAKQLSSKVWDKIVAQLKVEGGKATFNGKTLVTSKGPALVPDLPDGSGIH